MAMREAGAAPWLLLCLPPGIALPMGLQALGQRPGPEEQDRLTDLALRSGVGPTLVTYLEGRGDPLLERADMAPVHRLLQRPEPPAPLIGLPPVTAGADLIRIARDPAPHALCFDGFHPPEEAGIWTARPQASIRALPDPECPVTALSGSAALLDAALAEADQSLTITATEETTGRHQSWSGTRSRGGPPKIDWTLALPRFTGPLRIDLSLPACHSPRDLGASADPRPLGLLLHSLHLESTPPQLAAAE